MIEGKFVARKTSDDPIIYRVSFNDRTGPVEVGLVSERRATRTKRTLLALGRQHDAADGSRRPCAER